MAEPVVLPCLSLRQPWAWAMLEPNGPQKDVENRVWEIKYRGPLIIHAAKGCTRREYSDACEFIHQLMPHVGIPRLEAIQRGGIVGAFELFGPTLRPEAWPTTNDWHMAGQFGHRARNAVKLPFRGCRGSLGLFKVELTDSEAETLREAGLISA